MKSTRAWKLIAFAPVLVVLYANWLFVRNHFYVHGPYFHDSGWFSETVFRAGIIPRNPELSLPMVYYWGWHVTGIVSLASTLSYAFPGDRVEWYCLFQAVIYAPLALAVPILVPTEARAGVRSALFIAFCSLTFAFGGQVVSCMGYPHFEIFASAGLAIMLAALAVGRERLAGVGLAMAIGTREDCGFHAASFLVAVLAADFLGRPFPVARRRLLMMTAVGLASTALMIVIQKKFFVSVDAFAIYITGIPPYAHLTGPVFIERLAAFGNKCGFIWLPLLATGVVALARRDARYMLGWVVTLPWLFLNLTAAQDVKSELGVYTGFPFVGSAFWVFAYGRVEESRQARRSWRWPFIGGALVSILATLGMYFSFPASTVAVFTNAFVPAARNPAGLRAFARGLRVREYGSVRMDPSIASWAIEGIKAGDFLTVREGTDGMIAGDGYAFFLLGRESIELLARSPFPRCGRVAETPAYFCTKAGGSLPSTVVPASPVLALQFLGAGGGRREGETVVVDRMSTPEIAIFGPYVRLAPGAYTVTWDLEVACDAEAQTPLPRARVDVIRERHMVLAERKLEAGDGEVALSFEVTSEDRDGLLEFRSWSGSCAYVLRGIDVRHVTP